MKKGDTGYFGKARRMSLNMGKSQQDGLHLAAIYPYSGYFRCLCQGSLES
jgi:hypothetical protein